MAKKPKRAEATLLVKVSYDARERKGRIAKDLKGRVHHDGFVFWGDSDPKIKSAVLIDPNTKDHVEHLQHIAEMIGEQKDIGATWEGVALLQSEHKAARDLLKELARNPTYGTFPDVVAKIEALLQEPVQ